MSSSYPMNDPQQAGDGFELLLSSTLRSRVHTAPNRDRARQLAWRWIREKWPRLASGGMDLQGGRLVRAYPGARLTVRSADEGASWIADITEVGRDSREWRTRLAVLDGASDDILLVQTACTSGSTPLARVAPPKLLAAWTQDIAVHDAGEPISGEPWWVDDGPATSAFVDHLMSGQRALPVVTLASKGASRYFGVAPEALAQALRGMAHVACVSQEARLQLSRCLGPRLAPIQAAARIYAPGLAVNDSPANHALVRQPAPADAERDHGGATTFRQAIIRSACASSVRAVQTVRPQEPD